MNQLPYSDVERFADGSGKWLWTVYLEDRLWLAGISDSRKTAMVVAANHLARLAKTLETARAKRQAPALAEETIDFDALEASEPQN